MPTPPNRLRELRKAHSLKVTALAADLEKDASTLVRYERGDTGIPDAVKRALAERYGVSVDWLMGWDRAENAA